MSVLVDYHVHLDLFQDHEQMLVECENQKIEIFTMTTTPLAWERNKALAKKRHGIRVGLGIHPQLVAQRASEIELFEKLAPAADFIGEVGLDAGPRFYKSLELQREVFLRVLKVARQSGPKIFSIHSIRSASKVLDCIESEISVPRAFGMVLHWFTGSKSEAQRAVEMGCYFSVNPMMLRSETGRKTLLSLPSERLLTETDGPFTEKYPGCRYLSADLAGTIAEIGDLFGLSPDDMRQQVEENLMQLEAVLGKAP